MTDKTLAAKTANDENALKSPELLEAEKKSELANLEDGVYFDFPEDDYHSLARLSSSGIQSILVSPATFWADSWLNPDKPFRDDDTPARLLGRAYHTARLEPEYLHKRFVCDLGKEDMPEGSLLTDAAVKAKLKEMEQPQTKAGEDAFTRAARLCEMGFPSSKIFAIQRAVFEEGLEGRSAIKKEFWDQLIQDMKRIHGNPEVAQFLTGGQPEVTILWTDPETGIKMKCRIDYVTSEFFTDFKTFANAMRKPLEQMIMDAFTYSRYYIQVSFYLMMTEIIRSKKIGVQGSATDEQRELIDQIQQRKNPLVPWYVFQEKNGVPNLLAYEFVAFHEHGSHAANDQGGDEDGTETMRQILTNPTAIFHKAMIEIDHAKHTFLTYQEVYEEGDPWHPINPIRKIDDSSFRPYFLDTIQGRS